MPTASPGPAPKRRGPGRPPKINLDSIVEAAITLGLDSFSMHGIAELLGVTAPALYSHVSGRGEVLDLVNGAVHQRLRSFTSPATDWRQWLDDFARLVRAQLGGSASALTTGGHPIGTDDQLELGEQGLELLIADGFSPHDAGYVMWLVFRVAITAGADQATRLTGYVTDTARLIGPTASDLPATQAVQTALSGESHDTFDFDLAVILAGIDQLPRTR
ncbi:MAG: TetR/AcrR family transcriptional regulator C-terminal domain-containing protein [Aquihabitans sp.]